MGHNPIVCGKCMEKCEKKCIDFNMSAEEFTLKVGTIVVATGLDVYNPAVLDEYGYTRHENVMTSVEFERLINAGGPTQGDVVRVTDREAAEVHRLYPVRGLPVPAAGVTRIAPTSAA